MTLDEAKLNFGRAAVFTSADGSVTERGEISSIWYDLVQFTVGEKLRFVSPSLLELAPTAIHD